MNIPTTSIRAGMRKGSVRSWALSGTTLLMVAVVAVTAERRVQDHSHAAPVVVERAETLWEPGAAQEGQVPASVYYIVGSTEQSAATQVEVAERNRLRFLNGERDIQATVLVAGTAQAEQALAGLQVINQTRRVNGLPEIDLVYAP